MEERNLPTKKHLSPVSFKKTRPSPVSKSSCSSGRKVPVNKSPQGTQEEHMGRNIGEETQLMKNTKKRKMAIPINGKGCWKWFFHLRMANGRWGIDGFQVLALGTSGLVLPFFKNWKKCNPALLVFFHHTNPLNIPFSWS
jgi:hypothetical protein